MLLSKLVYLTIKNAIYYDDKSFNFQTFKKGLFDESPDYALNINNAYTPINEAVARLSDLERIPYAMEEIERKDIENGIIDLTKFSKDVKQVISVAQLYDNGTYRALEWSAFGIGKIRIIGAIDKCLPVSIEFKEDIPQFDEDSFEYTYDEDDVETQIKDIDLKEFGITESMCNYIMEYAMGKLTENVSAELANMHITRSEQYFSGIRAVTSAFDQRVVQRFYRIGE